MKRMCISTIICLLLSGCSAIDLSNARQHIELQKAQRTKLVAQLKANDPDNWHEILLDHDINAIDHRRQKNLGLNIRMLWIQYETDVLVEDSRILREKYDQIVSESNSVRKTLTEAQREEYKNLGAQTSKGSSPESRMQKLQRILTKEQFAQFNSLFDRAIRNARHWEKYYAAGSSLSKEYESVLEALQITSRNDKQASQARWRNMWQDYTQQQRYQQQQGNSIMLQDTLRSRPYAH